MSKEKWHRDLEAELRYSNHRSLILVVSAQMHEGLNDLINMHRSVPARQRNFNRSINDAFKNSIIDQGVKAIFHNFRQVRNLAAHESGEFSLESEENQKELRNVRSSLPNITLTEETGREIALMCGANLVLTLHNAIRNKQLQEMQLNEEHEAKIWLKGPYLMDYAFPKGTRP